MPKNWRGFCGNMARRLAASKVFKIKAGQQAQVSARLHECGKRNVLPGDLNRRPIMSLNGPVCSPLRRFGDKQAKWIGEGKRVYH
jgi:hypothetical protein